MKMARKTERGKKGWKLVMKRGAWTAEEDKKLVDYVLLHGDKNWRSLPEKAGLNRCGKSCRLRWLNYLRPDIKRGNISEEEEDLIIRLHNLLGNRWSLIAARLPGRTDNEIKNYWNAHLSKRCLSMDDLNRKLQGATAIGGLARPLPTRLTSSRRRDFAAAVTNAKLHHVDGAWIPLSATTAHDQLVSSPELISHAAVFDIDVLDLGPNQLNRGRVSSGAELETEAHGHGIRSSVGLEDLGEGSGTKTKGHHSCAQEAVWEFDDLDKFINCNVEDHLGLYFLN